MTLTISTDGGSRGNPGPASIGIVMYLDSHELFTHSEQIGIATNNTAEYTAVIRAFEIVKQHAYWSYDDIEFKCDSKLLVEQLSGRYKVKTPHIQVLHSHVKRLEREIGASVRYIWVARDRNQHADSLVNRALDN